MKRALILGGTGAIGASLVDILCHKSDWEVYVTSRSFHNNYDNVHFFVGNALDRNFIDSILRGGQKPDVIVDFMNYGHDEFMNAVEKLTSSTNHYIFLSSSRVYAFSKQPLTEHSPRLLDVIKDNVFLSTQRYALRKARQEDRLHSLSQKNYTIVRPYITYSDNRLQLGIYEKEQWLQRILNHKPLLIRREILSHTTTLTYSHDVALGIFHLMERGQPDGEVVHLVSEETKKWDDILKIYIKVFRKFGIYPSIYVSDEIPEIEKLYEGSYNTIYDRLYDRVFNNRTARTLCGHIDYLDVNTGLSRCLCNFIEKWKQKENDAFLFEDIEFEKLSDYYLQNGDIEQIY